MDALTKIRAKINDFPGYGSETDIARSDEETRAYVGERLAALRERLGADAVAQTLDPLIQRSAFANQQILASLERPDIHPGSEIAIDEADLVLLDLADTAASVDSEQVPEYAAKVTAAFDARDAALTGLKPRT